MKEKTSDLVSAIITTYKRECKIVKRAIDSVVNQTYKNIEIIIVNDYPDECENNILLEEMINEYKKNEINIKYIVVDKNGGACKARNIGIHNATGSYIGFLDDDDEWLENKVSLMIQKFIENQNVAIVYSNAIIYNDDKKTERMLYNSNMPSGYIYRELFITNVIGSNSFPFHRKEILEKYGGFNESLPAMQDLELYLRICKNNDVYYINEPLSKYYIYQGDRITKNTYNRVKAFEIIYEEFKNDIENDNNSFYYFCRRGVNVYSLNSNYHKAFCYWWKEICLKPKRFLTNLKDLFKIFIRFFYKKTNT